MTTPTSTTSTTKTTRNLKAVPAPKASPKAKAPEGSSTPTGAPRTAAPEAPREDAGAKLNPRTYQVFFPSYTKGAKTLTCPHTSWGHSTEATARKCLSTLKGQMSK
jgi:hypothetical protein